MRRLVTIFLGAFLLDGLLSVADVSLPTPVLGGVRNVVAWAVVVFGVYVYAAMAFVPALPKRWLLPAVAFLVWASVCGGFPLAFVAPDSAGWLLPWAQLVLGGVLLTGHWRGRRDLPAERRGFSWGNLGGMAALTVVVTPLVLAAATVHVLGSQLEAATGGFVKLRTQGLLLEEREFERDGRRVRLVGMMHIGDDEFYKQVFSSLPAKDGSVVLLEGVTDETGLLKNRFSYSKIAKLLGLGAQESSDLQRANDAVGQEQIEADGRRVSYRHADVDIDTFEPLTLELLGTLGKFLSNPTVEVAMRLMRDPDSPLNDPGAETTVQRDLIDKRNAHLFAEVERAVGEFGVVVVPWGAMHLPFVARELERQGFRETRRESRPVIRFWGAGAS